MRQNESFTIRLKALLSRLDDMQGTTHQMRIK